MLAFPDFSPVALDLGFIQIRWYGLMYLFGFITAYYLGKLRLKTTRAMTPKQFEDAVSWCILGVMAGGRLGYVLFYDLTYYINNPVEILFLWQGGMSFHGGLLGVLAVLFLLGKKWQTGFFSLVDFAAPLVAPGLFFGRLGNFINAELWGRTTNVPWGMVFPGAGDLPRHPSQLYEAFLEGILLFAIVWVYSSKQRPTRAVSGVFAICYGLFRLLVEFFREPDAHLGYLAFNFVTMGMLLCLPMILIGIYLLMAAYKTSSPKNN